MKNNFFKKINNILLTTVITVVLVVPSFAQESTKPQEPETLFSKGIAMEKIGFMASVGADYTQLSRKNFGMYSAKGGIVFNNAFTVGGYYGEGLWDLSTSKLQSVYGPRVEMEASMWGGFLEYTILSNRLLHLTMPLKIGAIHLEIDDYENPNDWDNYESYLFSVEPQLHVEINIHKYARFFIGGGYRFVGAELYGNGGFIPAPGNAISAQAGIKIGMFTLK